MSGEPPLQEQDSNTKREASSLVDGPANQKRNESKTNEGAGLESDNHPKKKKLVKSFNAYQPWKKQMWLAGHFSSIVFGGISLLFQIFWIPNRYYINSICYRLALLGSMAALFATTSHKFGIRNLPPAISLLAQQNFQYFILATIWIFTFKSVLKILPYLLISLLQIASHQKNTAILNQGAFFSSIISCDELLLIVYLLLRTILLRGSAGYQLVIFLGFYWLRILFIPETANFFSAIIQRLDGKASKIKNPKFQKAWFKVKQLLEHKSSNF